MPKLDPYSFGLGYSAGVETALKESAAELTPHSNWLPFGDTGSEYRDRWMCANCKRTCRAEQWSKICEYERCPHCGAIMGRSENT